MTKKRREFLKLAGLTSLGVAGGSMLQGFALNTDNKVNNHLVKTDAAMNNNYIDKDVSIIGLYGAWANSLNENKLPSFSFRRKEYTSVGPWQKAARQRAMQRLAVPDIGG